MPEITFITQGNETIKVSANSGSIMTVAVENNVSGIDGDCGGVCSCATCHVHLNPEDIERIGAASEIEKDMLELDDNANEYSRLGCQIPINDTFDGLVLKVAN